MNPPKHMDFSDSIWNLIRIQRSFWASGPLVLLACTLTRPKGIVGQKTYCKMAGKQQVNSDPHNSFHLFNESKKSES
jgi:hypothetical protein